MLFQLKKVVLWPRKPGLEPRVLNFLSAAVNVISGASKTGKSAIIPIVDYCLCSSECKIPVDVIRNTCGWFGIVIQTADGEKLLARREPGDQQSTGDMFFAEDRTEVEIPFEIDAKNATADRLRKYLDELSGLSNLDFDLADTQSGFRGRPSFGDMKAFCFQPQNIVANPDVLFFKADTYEHREKLKTVFPYVLGAVTPAILAAQHEERLLKRELQKRARDLAVLQQASTRWQAQVRSWAMEARDLGLTEQVSDDASSEALITLLRELPEVRGTTSPTSEGINDVIQEVISLRAEESDVAGRLSALRRRLEEMSKLRESLAAFQAALETQRDRLSISSWLQSLVSEETGCPLCHSSVASGGTELDELCRSLAGVERDANLMHQTPASFDRELLRVKEEIQNATESLRGVRLRLASAEERTAAARTNRYQAGLIDRFLGRVEQALTAYDASASDSELAAEVDELRSRLHAVQRRFSQSSIDRNIENAITRLTTLVAGILPNLDAERPRDPVVLSIKDLTVQVLGGNRRDYLWEIGSGANWLSYHVAVLVALHEFFLGLDHSAVPGLLVLDQPSQVYFPRRLTPVRDDATEESDPTFSDEDVEAVRMVFEALDAAIESSREQLQFLVLDHAGEDVWRGLPNVHCVEEWRDGRALIPEDWLTS